MASLSMTPVVDMHVHVGNFARLREDIQHLLSRDRTKRDFDLEHLFSSPRRLLDYLRKEGVERAVILGEEGPGTHFHITTEFVCDFRDAAGAAGRDFFIAFGSMNPHRTPDLLSQYEVDRLRGVRGYKLYPADHGFHPISDSLMEFYRRCEADGLIVMFHTGETAQEDGVQEYGDPRLFVPILKAFPKLTFIFAHSGKPNFCREAAECAVFYPNCYLDTAFIDAEHILTFLPGIHELSDKVLFGSDWPAGVNSLADHIARYNQLDIPSPAIDRILRKNALRMLHLD